MSIMRMRLKLRGIYLYDTSDIDSIVILAPRIIFDFADASYNKILFDSGFSLDTTYTTDEVEACVNYDFTETTESLVTTERFIYPLILKPIAVIDGTVKGSTKIALRLFVGDDAGSVWLTKLIVTLLKVDQDANETIFGTVTQDFKTGDPNWPSTIATDGFAEVWRAFPFFFDVKNEKIDYNDRLILEIKPYALTKDLTTDHARFYFAGAPDADNQYVDIPIV